MKQLGQVAYERYAKVSGRPLVHWNALVADEQACWHAAAEAAVRELWGPDTCPPTARAPEGYP